MSSVNRVFCSYAHEDVEYFEQLGEHLSALRRTGDIQMWSDREIKGGDNWNSVISDALESSDAVLMLVSPSFINSDYIFDVEMKRALELAETGQTIALPILIRRCPWEEMPFAHLQMMPNDTSPILPIANRSPAGRDDAWCAVAKTVRDLLRHKVKPTPTPEASLPRGGAPSQDGHLLLNFLRNWPSWGFNVARIRGWGGRQPGFEELARKTSAEIAEALEALRTAGKVTSFASRSGTPLYTAR